jgi:ribonuclease J
MSKTKNKARLAALPLGGVGEIGRNMMVYECDGELIIVDAGVSFADAEAPGVDIVLPDTQYLRQHADKIQGVFITHAHEDHIGAIGYLWEELAVPVHVSPFAKKVLANKLSQLGHKPGKRVVEVQEGQRYSAGKFDVEYIAVTHSILEAFSLAIHTPHGTIVHTGDYKFDEQPALGASSNLKRFRELGEEGVLAMVGDSTGAFVPGHAGSESTLIPQLEKILQEAPQTLFFTSFASNTGRMIKMIDLAVAQGRKVCLLGRTAQNMVSHAKELGYFPGSLTNHLISVEEAAGTPRNKLMVIASGTQGEPNASLTRLSQGANIKGLKVKEGDVVLMSSKMIPGNERKILDVLNNLVKLGASIITEDMDAVHVSGHGGRADMKKMYDMLKPEILIPVHGEEAHLVEQGKWGKSCGIKTVLQVRNGQKVVLGPEEPHVMQAGFPHGVNYVDGFNILDDDIWVVGERRKISYNGIVMVALAVGQETRELMADPVVHSRGLIDPTLQGELHEEAQKAANDVLATVFPDQQVGDLVQAEEAVRKAVGRVFRNQRGKKPVVVVQVVEV